MIDVTRLSPNLKNCEFVALAFTVKDDGVEYDHGRIGYYYQGRWHSLATCEQGVLIYRTPAELCADLDKINAWKGQPTFTCPNCGRTSYNATDAERRYCGACNKFFFRAPDAP